MLNQIGMVNKVPNNYIYTSHRGSEYIFLEGTWYNCENMKPIDSSKTFKMNQSAVKQISEQNTSSTLKIGQQYLINESAYVYVGRGKVTKDGFLLHENSNKHVVTLLEDDESTKGDQVIVPDGYVYTSGKGKKYYKKNSTWYSSETKKPINSSSAIPLERAASARIAKDNENSTIKIGDEWTSNKGVTYKYAGGNRFISDSGKLLPPHIAADVYKKLSGASDEEQGDEANQQSTGEPNQSGKNDVKTQDSNTDSAPAQNKPSNNSSSTESNNDPLQGLANQVKSNPEARRIATLISRGDDLSLLAADILLAGQQKETVQILNSLNNED